MRKRMFHSRPAGTLWTVILALAWAVPVSAQTPLPSRSAFWVELGGVLRGQSDLMASPELYRGFGSHVAAGYDRIRPGRRFHLDVSFATARLTSPITQGQEHTEDVYVVDLGVRSLFRVGSAWGGRVRFFAGAQADLRAPVRVHDYKANMTEVYGDFFLPFQAAGSWEAVVGRTTLSERLALPVFALVGRCPYTSLKYVPDFSVAPPGRLLGFDHALSVTHPLSGRLDVRAEWRTTFLRYPTPRKLAMVTHQVDVAVALHGRDNR